MSRMGALGLLGVAVLQFAVPALPSLGFGETIGDRAVNEGLPPELPPGVFFAIWGVIFLGYTVTAVLALVRPIWISERLIVPLILAGLGNCIWMLSSQLLGLVWLDLILLWPILAASWWAAYRLDLSSGYDGTWRSVLHGLTVGLLSGWLCVAVSISVPDLARDLLNRGVSDAVWQSLWMALIPAAILAYVFACTVSRNLWFFAALGWGLAGIAVNNWVRLDTHGLALVTVVVGWIILGRRLRYGAKGARNGLS